MGFFLHLFQLVQIIDVSFFLIVFIVLVHWASTHSGESLHLGWIEAAQSLGSLFFLLILVNPFGPIDLDVLAFGGRLS